MVSVGIYGVSTQCGMAYLADMIDRGYRVIGYARPTEHGRIVADAIQRHGGLWCERPMNQNEEPGRFIPLRNNIISHNIQSLINGSDIIIIPIPAHYHIDAGLELAKYGLAEKRTPLVLSPSRTIAAPYLWQILGKDYPIACFATSPYSCKTFSADTVFIKRRKRMWLTSLEGKFRPKQTSLLKKLFPQAAFTTIPAYTSLNNMGIVFHPAAYIMNYKQIVKHESLGIPFSFYIEGICENQEAAAVIEEIDAVRLKIAGALGLQVFGLQNSSREATWLKLTENLRALEQEHQKEISELRNIRGNFFEPLDHCVVSAQHWLDMTYGVPRIPGEALAETIRRTPTYQKMSLPQNRYIEEDIPTGLVPLEALARRLKIPHQAVSKIIDSYNKLKFCESRKYGRNLNEFSNQYITDYLTGRKIL